MTGKARIVPTDEFASTAVDQPHDGGCDESKVELVASGVLADRSLVALLAASLLGVGRELRERNRLKQLGRATSSRLSCGVVNRHAIACALRKVMQVRCFDVD